MCLQQDNFQDDIMLHKSTHMVYFMSRHLTGTIFQQWIVWIKPSKHTPSKTTTESITVCTVQGNLGDQMTQHDQSLGWSNQYAYLTSRNKDPVHCQTRKEGSGGILLYIETPGKMKIYHQSDSNIKIKQVCESASNKTYLLLLCLITRQVT